MGLFSRRHDDPAPDPEERSAPAQPRDTGPWDRDEIGRAHV